MKLKVYYFQKQKNCETFINQNQTKPHETLEFKINQSRKKFSLKPPISFDWCWIGLTGLEVYNSIFKKTRKILIFELYPDLVDEFSFTDLKHELEHIFGISNFTHNRPQDKTIGPRIINAYRKTSLKNRQTDGYYMLLMGYARSPFRIFGSYLRIVVGLDEHDIQISLNQYISIFIAHEIPPRFNSIKDISEIVYTIGNLEGTLQIEYGDISMKKNIF